LKRDGKAEQRDMSKKNIKDRDDEQNYRFSQTTKDKRLKTILEERMKTIKFINEVDAALREIPGLALPFCSHTLVSALYHRA